MKHIKTFESFINEGSEIEDLEFDQWYKETEHQHDHRLKKFARLLSIKLPSSTGSYHNLETKNIQMSADDLLKYGLVPASSYDIPSSKTKPGNELSLVWDSNAGLVIVNDGNEYTSKKVADKYKNKKSTYEKATEASDDVYEIWLQL